MHFDLVDAVMEQSDSTIVTLKAVTNAEEYLQDHFPGFPVLPGVFMIEAMVQAGRRLVAASTGDSRYVLGEVRALKYGTFVRPGESMRVSVEVRKRHDDGRVECRGQAVVVGPERQADDAPTCVSGRFTLRPVAPC